MAVIVLAATGLIVFFALPEPTVQILNYAQLTHDGRVKRGLATDGVWAYFVEQGNNGSELCKVSLQGGEITRVPLNLLLASVVALSPDGTRLLLEEPNLVNLEQNLWFFSISGRLLHRLAGGVTFPVAWAPAKKIVYGQGSAIWTSDEDGTHQTRVLNLSDPVGPVGWSPDAKRIWFATIRSGGSPISVGEVDADGGNPRRILEENRTGGALCSGFWSASGASFGFISSSRHLTTLRVAPDS
jgi:hypothetical protein